MTSEKWATLPPGTRLEDANGLIWIKLSTRPCAVRPEITTFAETPLLSLYAVLLCKGEIYHWSKIPHPKVIVPR